MNHQYSILPEHKWKRYEKARKEASSELMSWVHGMSSEEDVFDRLEMAFLWRSSCEGHTMSEPTWELMIEATE